MAWTPTAADYHQLQTNFIAVQQQFATAVANLQAAPAGGAAAPRRVPVTAPPRFAGDPAAARTFRGQCSAYLVARAADFNTEAERVAFVYTLLDGPVAAWATTLLDAGAAQIATVQGFLDHIRDTWGPPVNRELAERKLRRLLQREHPLSQYIADFRVLANQVRWNDEALRAQFLDGLRFELQGELMRTADLPVTLEAIITLSLRLDGHLQARQQWNRGNQDKTPTKKGAPEPRMAPATRPPPPQPPRSEEEPMQLGTVRPRLDATEKARRTRLQLCWYCGVSGHFSRDCPTKPKTAPRLAAAPLEEATPEAEGAQPAGEESGRV